MIHYDLRCVAGHEFDGWFRSSSAFDQQAGSGLVDCPVCASTQVSRALMAPRVLTGIRLREAGGVGAEASPEPQGPLVVSASSDVQVGAGHGELPVSPPAPMPDQVRAVLQRIRAEVEQRCDYVGPKFAEEARAMHDGALAKRPIYGETTHEQAEALAEDGIEVARIPWVPRADG